MLSQALHPGRGTAAFWYLEETRKPPPLLFQLRCRYHFDPSKPNTFRNPDPLEENAGTFCSVCVFFLDSGTVWGQMVLYCLACSCSFTHQQQESPPIPAWRCSTILQSRDFPPWHKTASSGVEAWEAPDKPDWWRCKATTAEINYPPPRIQAPKLALQSIRSGSEGVKVTPSTVRKASTHSSACRSGINYAARPRLKHSRTGKKK